MSNDDFDLSNLLDTPAAPMDGAERARQTVAHRRRRRQMIGSSVGAFVLLVGAAGTTYAFTHSDKDVLLTKEASDNISTTSTSTSTSTSTTIPDPHQKYVGIRHDMAGAGLPLGTSIQTWGGVPENFNWKVGSTIYTWVRDKTGDMLWIERNESEVPAATDGYAPMEATVLAVFDIKRPTSDQYFCLGQCAKDNKIDTSIIGLIGSNEKVVRAWRADAKKLTLTEIPTTGITPYAQPDLPPLASRPDLYHFLAEMSNEELLRVAGEEGISSSGAGGGVLFFFDAKENRDVAVSTDGIQGHAFTEAETNGDFRIGGLKYKGAVNEDLLIYSQDDPEANDEPKILKAWILDRQVGSFTEVSTSDASY